MERTEIDDRKREGAELPTPPCSQSVAYQDARNELSTSVAVFLKDWKDGDFVLPPLAKIHARLMEEKLIKCADAYRALCSANHKVRDSEQKENL